MSEQRRLTMVTGISVALAVVIWGTVLPGLISMSTAVWLTLAVGVGALVGARFHKHAELPDSVKLH
jgi:hypothetical protein